MLPRLAIFMNSLSPPEAAISGWAMSTQGPSGRTNRSRKPYLHRIEIDIDIKILSSLIVKPIQILTCKCRCDLFVYLMKLHSPPAIGILVLALTLE